MTAYSMKSFSKNTRKPKVEKDNSPGTATQCTAQIAEAQKPVVSREGWIKKDFIRNDAD